MARAAEPIPLAALENVLLTKSSGVFAVSDISGDIDGQVLGGAGLYFHDTRFLSRSALKLDGRRPQTEIATQLAGDQSVVSLNFGSVQIVRERRIGTRVLETTRLRNPGPEEVQVEVQLDFEADFRSIFAVRGSPQRRRGELRRPVFGSRTLRFRYDGADGRVRTTHLTFTPAPVAVTAQGATYRVGLAAGAEVAVEVEIRLRDEGRGPLEAQPLPVPTSTLRSVEVRTSNRAFDEVLRRSLEDLSLLATQQHGSTFFAAGTPWFVALFGRDSLITGLQVLPYDSSVAAGTLRLLAEHQGRRRDPGRDEEPGKILHEWRVGEDANLGDVPHNPYYGSVDATPLFVMLLAEYVRWTGDLGLWQRLRNHADAAVRWIQGAADHDGDGLVDYRVRSPHGLDNQGWKDSGGAIVHRWGELAKPPIALVEVQAYAYRALADAAWLLTLNGEDDQALALGRQAEELRSRLRRRYWMPRRRYLALALDDGGRQVETVASNAGHALWAGALEGRQAEAVAARLLARDMFSGWGIRTLSAAELPFDPDDYQVGAVWPHDNSLIMAGLARSGFRRAAERVFSALFEAACSFPGGRLPEVFSGRARGRQARPTAYPVACNPQAWSAGAIPYMLTSALGLEPDAPAGRLHVRRPFLPDWLEDVRIGGLRVGSGTVDLHFFRREDQTVAEVEHLSGLLEVSLEP